MTGAADHSKKLNRLFQKLKGEVRDKMQQSYKAVMEREMKHQEDFEVVEKNYLSKKQTENFMNQLEREIKQLDVKGAEKLKKFMQGKFKDF